MRRYFTGLIPSEGESCLKECKGRGWKAYESTARAEIGKHHSGSLTEIVIEASNSNTAQKALNLIHTVHDMLTGGPVFDVSPRVFPADPDEHKQLYPDPVFDQPYSLQTSGFPRACRLAAIASTKRAYTYALSLYQVSQSIHANHPMDLEHYLLPNQHRSQLPHDHVRFAYSIVTAYAVLEQLGLALNGPAFEYGKWIPEKRADLEQRLTRAGFNLAESALWHLRGGRTRLEMRRKTQALRRADWASGRVRDEEVAVVDAIADLRSLRSGIAAHDVKDLACLLSVYDVANAQYLARRSILTCLQFKQK